MRSRSVVMAAIAGIGVAGAAVASRRADREAAQRFYDWNGSTDASPEVDGIQSRYPAYVNHVELFGSLHAADLKAVSSALPSDDVRPVRLTDGRAIVFLGGLHYRDLTLVGFEGAMLPYGEVVVAPLVSRTSAPPIVPLVGRGLPIPRAWRAGMFYLYVPVTHRWTRDAGWTAGFPKFVADLEFEESVANRAVHVAENGQSILRLQVPVEGAVHVSRQPMLGYTALDGKLLEFETRAFAYERMSLGGRGVALELGNHPVADGIRELRLSEQAFATLSWVTGRVIIPAGRAVGTARISAGYRGQDHWLGRYRIHYPGTAPVDQYAALTREGIERGIVRGGGRVLDAYTELDAEIRGRSESEPGGGAFESNREPVTVA